MFLDGSVVDYVGMEVLKQLHYFVLDFEGVILIFQGLPDDLGLEGEGELIRHNYLY
jgi:hypothetical protein